MHELVHKNKSFSSRAALVLAACWLMLLVSSTYAQTGTSTVRGTVADQQGALVQGATVTLRSAGKEFTRSQTTNDEGAYAFNSLTPDTYIIHVETHGFKKSVVTDVNLGANLSSTLTLSWNPE